MSKINSYLYIGDKDHASDKDGFLIPNGIKTIINCDASIPNFHKGDFEYINLRLFNKPQQDIIVGGEQLKEYITEKVKKSEPVLVHCDDGKSLSPALMIYTFMKLYRWTYDEATKYLSEFHQGIDINSSFIQQLVGGKGPNTMVENIEYIDEPENISQYQTVQAPGSNEWSSLRLGPGSSVGRPRFSNVGGGNYGRIFSREIPISTEDPMKAMKKM